MTALVKICGINSARVLFWGNKNADAWAVAAAELLLQTDASDDSDLAEATANGECRR